MQNELELKDPLSVPMAPTEVARESEKENVRVLVGSGEAGKSLGNEEELEDSPECPQWFFMILLGTAFIGLYWLLGTSLQKTLLWDIQDGIILIFLVCFLTAASNLSFMWWMQDTVFPEGAKTNALVLPTALIGAVAIALHYTVLITFPLNNTFAVLFLSAVYCATLHVFLFVDYVLLRKIVVGLLALASTCLVLWISWQQKSDSKSSLAMLLVDFGSAALIVTFYGLAKKLSATVQTQYLATYTQALVLLLSPAALILLSNTTKESKRTSFLLSLGAGVVCGVGNWLFHLLKSKGKAYTRIAINLAIFLPYPLIVPYMAETIRNNATKHGLLILIMLLSLCCYLLPFYS